LETLLRSMVSLRRKPAAWLALARSGRLRKTRIQLLEGRICPGGAFQATVWRYDRDRESGLPETTGRRS
jgi:hypothetical protein